MSGVFRRGSYSEVVLTLTSFEPLGLLQTDYIEDVSGVDGQVTLSGPGGLELEVLLTGLDAEHERFRAFLPLAGLPDGAYTVSGRARDVVGNETGFALGFEIAPGYGTVVVLPGLRLFGALDVGAVPLGQAAAGVPLRAPAAVSGFAPPAPLSSPIRPQEVIWQSL